MMPSPRIHLVTVDTSTDQTKKTFGNVVKVDTKFVGKFLQYLR